MFSLTTLFHAFSKSGLRKSLAVFIWEVLSPSDNIHMWLLVQIKWAYPKQPQCKIFNCSELLFHALPLHHIWQAKVSWDSLSQSDSRPLTCQRPGVQVKIQTPGPTPAPTSLWIRTQRAAVFISLPSDLSQQSSLRSTSLVWSNQESPTFYCDKCGWACAKNKRWRSKWINFWASIFS